MSRWKVYKDNEDRAWRWVAVTAHENWWEKPQWLRFPQWDLAMRYADRMARTAKPEIVGHPTSPDAVSYTHLTLPTICSV